MRSLAVFATVASLSLAALPAQAAPAQASVAEKMRAARLVCGADLRASSCGRLQQRLLDAVVIGGQSSIKAGGAQAVASRQLEVLIASIR